MCNACGFGCCAFDDFEGCGCNCDEWRCRVSRCGGCGQMVDASDLSDDCACFPDDDWTDEDDLVVSMLGNGSRERHADLHQNGSTTPDGAA